MKEQFKTETARDLNAELRCADAEIKRRADEVRPGCHSAYEALDLVPQLQSENSVLKAERDGLALIMRKVAGWLTTTKESPQWTRVDFDYMVENIRATMSTSAYVQILADHDAEKLKTFIEENAVECPGCGARCIDTKTKETETQSFLAGGDDGELENVCAGCLAHDHTAHDAAKDEEIERLGSIIRSWERCPEMVCTEAEAIAKRRAG